MDIKVDSLNGIDQIESTLYKTLDYALDSIANTTDSIINVYLSEGDYVLKLHDTLFNKNKIVNIKGKNYKTTITQTQGFYSNASGGSSLFTLNIYNLIYNMPNVSANWNYFKFNWNFYNVVFNNVGNESYGVFLPSSSILTINNCVKVNTSTNLLRVDYGKIYVKNSYGGFTSGYSTKQSNWDIENNIITNTPKLDSKYKITDIDIDNNLYGVYGGLYSWMITKYLLKNNNNYYTIKCEYCLNNNFTPITLTGGVTPNKYDFDTLGFSQLNELLTIVDTKIMNGIDKGALGTGKYFEINLDNDVKNIVSIE